MHIDDKKIIHLMKGKNRYITIMPYAEFKKLKKKVDELSEKLNRRPAKVQNKYDLRFQEEILKQLLDFYSGDLEKLNLFIGKIHKLRSQPFPAESKQIKTDIYRILINDLFVLYNVNKARRLITILSVER